MQIQGIVTLVSIDSESLTFDDRRFFLYVEESGPSLVFLLALFIFRFF